MNELQKTHRYQAKLRWTGAEKGPTTSYEAYSRDHTIQAPGKPLLLVSSDTAFLGDPSRYNPEDLLVAALSSCHMLSFLAIAARRRVHVLSYEDDAIGTMSPENGKLKFTDALLRPRVLVAAGNDAEAVEEIHRKAHTLCFVANSMNFPVRREAVTLVADRS